MNQKKHRKFWSLLLVLSMIFTVLPTNLVMAATNPGDVKELVKSAETNLSFTVGNTDNVARQQLGVIATTSTSSLEVETIYTLFGDNASNFTFFQTATATTSSSPLTVQDNNLTLIGTTSTAALKVVYVGVKEGSTLVNSSSSNPDLVRVTITGSSETVDIPIAVVASPTNPVPNVTALSSDSAPTFTVGDGTSVAKKNIAVTATTTTVFPSPLNATYTLQGTNAANFVLYDSTSSTTAVDSPMTVANTGLTGLSSPLTTVSLGVKSAKTLVASTDDMLVVTAGGITKNISITINAADPENPTPTVASISSGSILTFKVGNDSTVTKKGIRVTADTDTIFPDPLNVIYTLQGTNADNFVLYEGSLPTAVDSAITVENTGLNDLMTSSASLTVVSVGIKAGSTLVASNNDKILITVDGYVGATEAIDITITPADVVDPTPTITAISSASNPVFVTGDRFGEGKQSFQVTAHTNSIFPEVVTTYTLMGPNADKFSLYASGDVTDAATLPLQMPEHNLNAVSALEAALTPIYIAVKNDAILTTVTDADKHDYILVSVNNENVAPIHIPITINKKPTSKPKPNKDKDDDDKTTTSNTSSTSTPAATPKPTAADVAVAKPTEAQKVTVNAAVVKAKVTVASEPVIVKFPKDLEGTFTPITVTLANITNITESTILVRINPDGTMTPILANLTKDANGVVHANLLVNDGGTIVAINSTPQKFNDVKSGDWYSKYVDSVATKLYMTGMGMDSNGSNYFDPTATLTASQTSSIMLRILGIAPAPAKAGDNWDTGVIAKAKELGINNTANSNAPMSRKDTANAIVNALKVAGVAKDLSVTEVNSLVGGFKDLSRLSATEKQTMAACIKYNIFVGNGDGTMSPDANLTRAQMATLIDKVLKKAKGSF